MIISFFNNLFTNMSKLINTYLGDFRFLIFLLIIYILIQLYWPKPKKPKDPILQVNDTLKSIDNNLMGIKFRMNNINRDE